MSTCDHCTFAEWDRTKNGRLHPSKSGRCKRLEAHPLDLRLPAAFNWSRDSAPSPSGGWIERGKHHRTPCAFKAVKI